MFRIENLTIANVNLNGNNVLKSEEILNAVEKDLSGSFLWVVPKRNSLFFPKTNIEENLLRKYTRLESVSIVRRDLITLDIEVVERTPFALWCGNRYVDTSVELGNCYFIDETSLIFAKAPDFSGDIFFKYFGERNTDNVKPIGSRYMKETDFTGFNLFLEAFESLPFVPVSFTKIDDTDFSVRTNQGTQIIFGSDMSLSTILDNIESILESEALLNNEHVLEYIDLRFGNRAYYKFVGEEDVEEPRETNFGTSTDG